MELIDKNDLIKRMSIGAPMNWTDSERELGEESQYKSDMLHIQCSLEVPAIPIPPKATNGDMIKAMFPNAKFDNAMPFTDGRWETMNLDTENEARATNKPTQLRTYADWWNAPYRKE